MYWIFKALFEFSLSILCTFLEGSQWNLLDDFQDSNSRKDFRQNEKKNKIKVVLRLLQWEGAISIFCNLGLSILLEMSYILKMPLSSMDFLRESPKNKNWLPTFICPHYIAFVKKKNEDESLTPWGNKSRFLLPNFGVKNKLLSVVRNLPIGSADQKMSGLSSNDCFHLIQMRCFSAAFLRLAFFQISAKIIQEWIWNLSQFSDMYKTSYQYKKITKHFSS